MPPIYISQVQITGGKNNTNNDFIELFNASSSPVNLKGCRLVKRPENSGSDTLVKSWSKDAFIPAKSFYLWANSGFATISAKPDVLSTATISDNSGVALRLGPNNTGTIIDAISWGQANNGFKNVSAVSPPANRGLARQNLDQESSDYKIIVASPHNSAMTDLAAAFGNSRAIAATLKDSQEKTASPNPPSAPTQPKVSAESGTVNAPSVMPNTPATASLSGVSQDSPSSVPPGQPFLAKPSGVKYLILAIGSILALILVQAFRGKKP